MHLIKRATVATALVAVLVGGFAFFAASKAPTVAAGNCLGSSWRYVTSGDFIGLGWTGAPGEVYIEIDAKYVPLKPVVGQPQRYGYCGQARAYVDVAADGSNAYTGGTKVSICDTVVDNTCATSLLGTTTSTATIPANTFSEIDGQTVSGIGSMLTGGACPDTGIDTIEGYWTDSSGGHALATLEVCIPSVQQ